MNHRIRPQRGVDLDVLEVTSLVEAPDGPLDLALTLEDDRIVSTVKGRWVDETIERTRHGWSIISGQGPTLRLTDVRVARGSTVEDVTPLLRAAQLWTCEHAGQWVVARLSRTMTLEELGLAQNAAIPAADAWLFWATGFVHLHDPSSEAVEFAWRNPAW